MLFDALIAGAALVGANLLFCIAVLFAASIPFEIARDNVKDAIQRRVIDQRDYPMSPTDHFIDGFTECATAQMALDNSGTVQAAFGPLFSEMNGAVCPTLISDLFQTKQQGAPTPNRTRYHRYWHGTTAAFKVGLALFPVAKLRFLISVLLLLACLAVVHVSRSVTKTGWVGLIFVAYFAMFTDWQSWVFVFSHTAAAVVTMLAFAFMLGFERMWVSQRATFVAVTLVGACICFIDTLVWSPVALSLALFAAVLRAYRSQDAPRRLLLQLGLIFGAWIMGWAGSFAIKQIVAMLAFPEANILEVFFSTLKTRVGTGQAGLRKGLFGSTSVVMDSIGLYSIFSTGLTLLIFAASVGAFFATVALLRKRNQTAQANKLLVALVPAFVPILWFEVLSQHTQVHASSFTARPAFLVPAILLCCAVLALTVGIDVAAVASPKGKSRR